jgi:hypothetical protein
MLNAALRILKVLLRFMIVVPVAAIGCGTACCRSSSFTIQNAQLIVRFGDRGLRSVQDRALRKEIAFARDAFSLSIDGHEISSDDLKDPVAEGDAACVRYLFDARPYRIEVVYNLRPGWRFIGKALVVTAIGSVQEFHVDQLTPIDIRLSTASASDYVATSRWVKAETPGRNYGIFKRFPEHWGLFGLVQNPFLTIEHEPSTFSISYSPGMAWNEAYGPFKSDLACIGTYELSGQTVPVRAVPEWKWQPTSPLGQEVEEDASEISAFMNCVHSVVLDPYAQAVAGIHVGWTENDYQIDLAQPEGRVEYKRIIDCAATLGLGYVLFAPSNSQLSSEREDADSWHWEHVLWLGLGQKIRKGQWNIESSAIPDSIREMLDYAKSKNVRLVAYVYPTLPFAGNPNWLVGEHQENASLANRDFQDWLIKKLLTFYRRTGIGGYSFDYTWLDLPGSTQYAQWWGWRRILEALRAAEPNIVIDGRQRYQAYGPWIWLAGSYPHPTSTDEQPESFTPFPDLHFDRVSADRERYTAYLYRIDDFCPPELMPGFIGHQTPRNDDDGQRVDSSFRKRDWDYLGWRYSLISSIAVAGLNNVVNMIPARDLAEDRFFSPADARFFRQWLGWAKENRAYLLHTRFILGQPQMGRVDGTSALIGSRGYLFLFNPNARKLQAKVKLDRSIGLAGSGTFLLRELYPPPGVLVGKPHAGFWTYADEVSLVLDGASAVVLEISPAPRQFAEPLLFNASGNASLRGGELTLSNVRGEPGTTRQVDVLLPSNGQETMTTVVANGQSEPLKRNGNVVALQFHFEGQPFSHMQQVGTFDPNFAGATFKASFNVPQWVLDQLKARQKAWPIPWTENDLKTTWLAPQRLLLFVQIAEPSDRLSVHMTLDGRPVELEKAYSSVRPNPGSFVGFYADESNLHSGRDYEVELTLPPLRPGQFQGVFFENVEPGSTTRLIP